LAVGGWQSAAPNTESGILNPESEIKKETSAMFKTALRFLIFDKAKSIGALAGVIISVFLIGQQVGLLFFFFDAMGALAINNQNYVWVTDNKTKNVNALSSLDMRVGRQLAGITGVDQVHPIVVTAGAAKFANGKSGGLTLIGVQYPEFAGGPWRLEATSKNVLLTEGAVVTDYFDRAGLGDVNVGDYFEINGKKVFLAANTKGVRSFAGTYAFTTIDRARYLGNFPTTQASAFLVKWKSGTSAAQVIANINASPIFGIRAWEANELSQSSINELLGSSGIAFSLGSLIVFALIVGFVIIGLTLYSAAIDRIRDYGTLKAIGANNWYVRRLILTQAMLIAVVGFGLGYMLVLGFKQGIAQAGTLFEFPIWAPPGFLAITLFIAFFGAGFAIRRIVSLEPSAVFRG
jgi:putative ABC transport system permease protein